MLISWTLPNISTGPKASNVSNLLNNKIFASILRMVMSLLKTPFCTGIGQVCSSVYQFISVSIFFKLNYDIAKTGEVIPKKINNKDNV